MKLQLYSVPSYFLYIFIFLSSLHVYAKEKDNNIQIVIHLLDYLSKDYPMAVRDGKILNVTEYAEIQEFSIKIFNLAKTINFPSESSQSILSDLNDLKALVQDKSPSKKIKDLTEKVKWAIIKVTGYIVAPLNWPDKAKGQSLYLRNCIQCHGPKGGGNGNLAVGLKPTPTNFLDDSLMVDLSPFEAYNTVKLGVEGTAMRSFTELTDKEAWDLSFYVKSLRFQKQKIDSISLKKIFNQVYGNTSLKDVATLSDNELMNKLGTEKQADRKLKALRLFYSSEKQSQSSLTVARNYLHQTFDSYKKGNKDEARQKALAAYLEGIEPVEVRLKANDPKFTSKLEQKMMDVRRVIEQGKNSSEVENKINSALSMIDQAEIMMKDKKLNYWLSFFLAASVMLREGLEAFLIIVLILALMRSIPGTKKALPYIHGGWITAILMGVVGWFFSDWIIDISGQNREIMEGVISLIAVIVIVYVGFWLHNHTHSKKWKTFIDKKIGAQLKGEKMIGLAFFSFMVVFREAFESILFLQAIGLETQSNDQSSIGFGVLAGFALIGLLAFIFLKFSKKIPVKQLIRYSSWLITLLAVILMGKGIHAIQEAGWLSVSGFPVSLKIDWLGIYPTIETLVAQLILLCLLLLMYYLSNFKNKEI